MTTSEGRSDVIHVYYGEEELQDVTLVANLYKFHVNKTFLADRSSYFKNMFSVGEGKIFIITERDGLAFKRMLDIIYYNEIHGDIDFLKCDSSHSYLEGITDSNEMWIQKFWNESDSLIKVVKDFGFSENCLPVLEELLTFNMCPGDWNTCQRCANRMILAIKYNLKIFKENIHFDKRNMKFCVNNNLVKYLEDYMFNPSGVVFLLRITGSDR